MGALFVFAVVSLLLPAATAAQVLPAPADFPQSQPAGGAEVSPAEEALKRYPPGGIKSEADADAALADALRLQPLQELRYNAARAVCYEKFLAEFCLSDARAANYRATRRIREVELEARQFKRSAEAAAIDQRRAEKRAAEASVAAAHEADAARVDAQREARRLEVEREARQFEAAAPQRAARAREAEKQVRLRAAARARAAAEERARAPQRAESARRQAAKLSQTVERAQRRERAAAEKARNQAPPPSAQPGAVAAGAIKAPSPPAQ